MNERQEASTMGKAADQVRTAAPDAGDAIDRPDKPDLLRVALAAYAAHLARRARVPIFGAATPWGRSARMAGLRHLHRR